MHAWKVIGRAAAVVLALAAVQACGFKLRADAPLPFEQAWVQAPEASALAPGLRNALQLQGKLAATADQAQTRIAISSEQRSKNILSLSSAGKVREYRLTYKVTLQASKPGGALLGAPIELEQVRDYTYDDALVQAADTAEATLYRGMEREALRQALRRLAYIK